MIAPPNRGSVVARKLRNAGFPVGGVFAACYGQAGGPVCLISHDQPAMQAAIVQYTLPACLRSELAVR